MKMSEIINAQAERVEKERGSEKVSVQKKSEKREAEKRKQHPKGDIFSLFLPRGEIRVAHPRIIAFNASFAFASVRDEPRLRH